MNNKEIFKQHGFCIVRNALSAEVRDIITQYALFDEMQNYRPEGARPNSITVPDAHSKYADPAMESLLLHLQSTIEKETGIALHPTYSYYRVYRNGDQLARHKDRPACEISSTLCFNYDYDDKEYQWPIYMDGYRIVLYPGDLVIYRGCDLDHYREKLQHSQDIWHVQGFFHYVDATGPNAHCKYDGRESIGEKEKPKAALANTAADKVVEQSKSYIHYVR